MDLSSFNNQKKSMENNYLELMSIAEKLKLDSTYLEIENAKQNLTNDVFNIVVVGEFSRGKSTFINALMGDKVLPAKTRPTTTVINKLSAGLEKEYALHFRESDEIKVLSEKDFLDLIALNDPQVDDKEKVKEYKKHKKYISSIAYANIKYPSTFLLEGVEIIDTPGTNDIDTMREEITYGFLPKADAAIMLLSAKQQLSQSEVAFLQERILPNVANNIFFVINQKDKLNNADQEKEAFDYVQEHLEDHLGSTSSPEIFMVSSLGALKYKQAKNGIEIDKGLPETFEVTGFPDFEKRLGSFLCNDRGRAKLSKYQVLGLRFANDIVSNSIDVKLASVDIPVQELEKNLNELKPVISRAKNEIKHHVKKLEIAIDVLKDDYVRIYKSGLNKIASEAGSVVTNYQGEQKAELVFREVERKVSRLQDCMVKELEDYKKHSIAAEIEVTYKKIDLIVNRLRTSATTNSLNSIEKILTLLKEDSKDFRSKEFGIFLTDSDLAGYSGRSTSFIEDLAEIVCLPLSLIGIDLLAGTRLKNFKADMRSAVEKRYGDSISSQVRWFSRNFDKVIDDLLLEIENHAKQEITNIEKQLSDLVNDKKSSSSSAEQQRKELTDFKTQVKKIKSRLEREAI